MIAYLRRLGLEMDVFLNVAALDGESGETISLHAAKADAAHRFWGCVLCRYLSITVETNHCAKTLAGTATSPAGAIMAGVQILAGFFLFIAMFVSWKLFF